MWVIILIILLLIILSRSEKEAFNQNIDTLPYIRENNIQVEQFNSSHVKDLNVAPVVEDQRIWDVYDSIVDDGRLAAQKYVTVDTIDPHEYFEFNNKQDYGFTSFSNY